MISVVITATGVTIAPMCARIMWPCRESHADTMKIHAMLSATAPMKKPLSSGPRSPVS
jgi:hypothetical protein